jgi:hypothetical protein
MTLYTVCDADVRFGAQRDMRSRSSDVRSYSDNGHPSARPLKEHRLTFDGPLLPVEYRGRPATTGKPVGDKQTVSAVRANAEQCAANLRAIVDELQAQGFTSVRAIATQLNERGILTPRGAAWHPTSAARLLSRLRA